MAAATYTSDQTVITDSESGTFTEPTGALLGTITSADTDNFIQGSHCTSKSTGASGAPALAGIGIQAATAQTITSPNAVYCWVFTGAGALIDTYANGGIRVIVGNTSANYNMWSVLGNDTYPYVGWTCVAVDPNHAADFTTGTPSGVFQYFGAVFNCLINIGKGNPMAIDKIAWGRTITILNGDLANGYATFAGIAAQNDTNTNRWGQFQAISGGYQLQGRLLFGTTGGTVVDSRDSNKSIAIAVSLKTATSFNAIEIQNTSSNIAWDSCVFTALGTNSRGTLTVTDNCPVAITNCTFTGMDTFTFLSSSTLTGTIWRGCNAITATGSSLTGTQILVPTVAANASALVWTDTTNTDGKLDGAIFSKGTNAHHAISLNSSTAGTYTLRNIIFTGFNASNAQNDSTINVAAATGTVTINLVGCSGNISYKTAGATVNLVVNPVTLSVHAQDASTGSAIQNARVWTPVTSTASGRLYNQTVTITNSGTTATVTATAHGLATNDYVWISGASLSVNNGTFQVTVTGTNSFTYTMASAPGSNPTGTIKATWVIINALTDASGNASASYSYLASQPISGHVRKSDAAPYYQSANVSGTVSSTNGLSVTTQLVLDQ